MKRRNSATIAIKKFEYRNTNDKNYRNVKDHCHYTSKYRRTAHSISNSKYSIPKEITAIFHDGSNMIIKRASRKI